MPEHIHLLVSEPQEGNLSIVMQVVKQRFARRVHWQAAGVEEVWQRRFYDFNVWTEKKRIEKLRYLHRNPVGRGLVAEPGEWPWSSFRYYMFSEEGPVRVNDTSVMKMRVSVVSGSLVDDI